MGETPDEPFILFTPNVADAAPPRLRAGRLPAQALGRWERGDGAPLGAAPPAAPPPLRVRPAVPNGTPSPTGASGARPGGRDPRSAQQDDWLNRIRRGGGSVDVVCLDGTQMRGRLVGFDTYALVVECEGAETLIFKHAIRLLRPVAPPVPGGA